MLPSTATRIETPIDRPHWSVVGCTVAVLIAVLTAAALAQTPPPPTHATSRDYNVALGVGCDHCHVENDFRNRTKPALDFASRMEAMVHGINGGPLRNRDGVTCWSCHRGRTTPARLPRDSWESIQAAHAADFDRARPGAPLAMSVYAASLGVDCAHCHVTGNWQDGSKRPHQTVAQMSAIFDLIPTFFADSLRQPRTQCFMCHQGRTVVERTGAKQQR